MTIITEEMKFRLKVVQYAIKNDNNALAARKYHTSRQQVQRWRRKFNGSIDSLALKSRRPHTHPNQHKQHEIDLIKNRSRRFKHEGWSQVYAECIKKGYTRSFTSMMQQVKKFKMWNVENKKMCFPKSNFKPDTVTFPGEKVQIDIKYVPLHCIAWQTYGIRYYQITAIDEYSRKRVCAIVDEKSVTHTAEFLLTLEEKMGFKICTIQTDNGREFTNDPEQREKLSLFEKTLMKLGIKYRKTRPYSPWQNGKVERSHRDDNEKFYQKQFFKSYDDMIKKHKRYMTRYNNIAKKVLNFKSPIQVVDEYFANAVVLDNEPRPVSL